MPKYTVHVQMLPFEQTLTLDREHALLAAIDALAELKVSTLEAVAGIQIERHPETQAEEERS
jgi:hypothetical protein